MTQILGIRSAVRLAKDQFAQMESTFGTGPIWQGLRDQDTGVACTDIRGEVARGP